MSVLVVAVAVAACGGGQTKLIGGKRSPDEFAVYTRAPLTMPPEFALKPPIPGSTVGEAPDTRLEARETLIGAYGGPSGPASDPDALPRGASQGTAAIMQRTGALSVDPDVRSRVNRESAVLASEDKSFTERLMFWSKPSEYGTVVDADREARRIRENVAQGQPITAGKTPTIERKKRAILEGIFN